MADESDNTGSLRKLLRANAAFSGVTGAIGLLAAGPVADFLEVDQVLLIRVLGVGLMGFGATVLALSQTDADVLERWTPIVSYNDFAWVVGTLLVLALGFLSSAGSLVMGLVGLVVLELGLAQMVARRRMLAAEGAGAGAS